MRVVCFNCDGFTGRAASSSHAGHLSVWVASDAADVLSSLQCREMLSESSVQRLGLPADPSESDLHICFWAF